MILLSMVLYISGVLSAESAAVRDYASARPIGFSPTRLPALQVVKANVSAQSRVRAADPFVKQLGHLDVAVVVHRLHRNDDRSPSVSLCAGGSFESRVQLFDPPKLKTVAELQDSVLAWSRSRVNASYSPKFLQALPEHLKVTAGNLIADMARAGAVAGSVYESAYHVTHDEEGSRHKLEVLERLMDVGFVHSQILEDDRSAWLVDMQALSQCQLQLELASPTPVFTQPAGLPALSWSRLEHLCYLHNGGWELQFLTNAEEKGAVLPINLNFRSSDDRIAYVYRGNLNQRYLACLSFVHGNQRLHGQPDELLHFQSVDYYSQLLGLEKKKTKPLPALADVSVEMFQAPQLEDQGFAALDDAVGSPGSAEPVARPRRARRARAARARARVSDADEDTDHGRDEGVDGDDKDDDNKDDLQDELEALLLAQSDAEAPAEAAWLCSDKTCSVLFPRTHTVC